MTSDRQICPTTCLAMHTAGGVTSDLLIDTLTSGGLPAFGGEKGICQAVLSHRLSLSLRPTRSTAADWSPHPPPPFPLRTAPVHVVGS